MIESAAEANEELMNKYLESGELSEDEIKLGIRTRTIASEILPMLCGSAFKNKGVQAHARRRDRIPAVAGGHPAGQGHERERNRKRRARRVTRRPSRRSRSRS